VLIAHLADLAAGEGDEERYERALAVLTSIVQVRSCLILAEIANEEAAAEGDGDGDPGALLVDFFNTLMDAVR
jgi:hypothetical protein